MAERDCITDLKVTCLEIDPVTSDGTIPCLDFTGSSVTIGHTATAAGEDFTIQQTGAYDASLFLTSNGTGSDAISVLALEGGINIDSAGLVAVDTTDTTNGVKIATATSGVPVTIGHATSEVTVSDNLIVTGDLTVSGNTIQNTSIEDKLIELATGTEGTPSGDSGIIIERGGSANAFMGWDESADKFILGTTDATGISSGDLTITSGTLQVAGVESSGELALTVGAAGVVVKGTTPKLTIGDADAEDTFLVFDGNAQDYRIGLDDGTDKLEIGVGAAHGTTTAITVDSSQAITCIGATTFSNTVTVGVDDTGYDVKLFGATSGAYMLWDESDDDLKLVGGAGLVQSGAGQITLTGNVDCSSGLDVTGAALTTNQSITQTGANANTLTGATTFSNTVTVTGELRAPVLKAPVENGDADLTVTEALHAGTVVMQTDVGADRTYTIPAPSAAGVTYRFLGQGTGAAADGHDVILTTGTAGVFFDGMITHHDTDADSSGSALNVGVWGNGTSHDLLTLNVPAGYDITLIAKSTTVFYITGTVTSADVPAFTAP